MTERDCARIGWVVAVILHSLLTLIFLKVTFDLPPFELSFSMIRFSATADTRTGSAAASPSFSGAEPLIELPQRPMLEDSSPLLSLPKSARKAVEAPQPQQKLDLVDRESILFDRREIMPSTTPSLRERAEFQPLPLSDEVLTGQSRDVLGDRISGDEMFSISWDGPARARVSGSLPEYPPNVNREATVRISFDVAPDGSVVFVSPLTKGLPELERVSMEALRGWRFNPLNRSLPQKKQRGTVTFVFQLK